MTNIVPFTLESFTGSININNITAYLIDRRGGGRIAYTFVSGEFIEDERSVGSYKLNLSRLAKSVQPGNYTLVVMGLEPLITSTITAISQGKYEVKISLSELSKFEDVKSELIFTHDLVSDEDTYTIVNVYVNEEELVLKLIKPLTTEKVGDNVQVSRRLFENTKIPVRVEKEKDVLNNLEFLLNANTSIIEQQTDEYSFTDLFGSGNMSESIRHEFLRLKNDTQLNIDYSDFSNHTYFASAQTTLDTAYNKIKQFIDYESIKFNFENSNLKSIHDSYDNLQREMMHDFTGYEWHVFSTGYPHLGVGTSSLLHYTTSQVSGWYVVQSYSASKWDDENGAQLWQHIPNYYFMNDDYSFMYNIIHVKATHFDYIKQHVDQLVNFVNANYDGIDMPPNELIWVLGKFIGFELHDGNSLKSLSQYLLGENVSGSNATVPLRTMTHKLWQRIINNITYIFKTKGSKESVRALLNSYGIPADVLQFNEAVIGGATTETGSLETFYHPIKSSRFINVGNNDGQLSFDIIDFIGSGSDNSGARTFELNCKLHPSALGGLSNINPLFTNLPLENGIFIVKNTPTLEPAIQLMGETAEIGDGTFSASQLFNDKFFYIAFGTDRDDPTLAVTSNSFFRIIQYDEDGILAYNTGFSSRTFTDGQQMSGFTNYTSNPTWSWNAGSDFASMSVMEFRLWDRALTETEMLQHAQDFKSIMLEEPLSNLGTVDERWNLRDLRAQYHLDDNIDLDIDSINTLRNSSVNPIDIRMTNTNYGAISHPTVSYWGRLVKNTKTFVPSVIGNRYDRKIRIVSGTESPNISDLPVIDAVWSPVHAIDRDILETIANLDFNDLLGDPSEYYSGSYHKLKAYRDNYFNKYFGSYDYNKFIKLATNMDRSLKNSIQQLIPARAKLNFGLQIGSHMLERNKFQFRNINVQIQPKPSGSIDEGNWYATYAQSYLEQIGNFNFDSMEFIGKFPYIVVQDGHPGPWELNVEGETHTAGLYQTFYQSAIFNTASLKNYQQNYMYAYEEIAYATYLGTINRDIDYVTTASAWVTSSTFGEQIVIK